MATLTHILVVDDEEAVRAVISRILRAAGYEVWESAGAEEALELVVRDPPAVDLAITDVVMPGLSGPALVRQLRALRPNLPVVFMSGDVDASASLVKDFGNAWILDKPFSPSELLRILREALGDH